jgi:hypothetical protein
MIPLPREKAQELVDYYYEFQDQDAEWCMIQNSKLCANRVVTEVMAFLTEASHIEYWMDVRLAIEEITYIENKTHQEVK